MLAHLALWMGAGGAGIAALAQQPAAPQPVGPQREALERLAERCGSEITWAASWEEAAARARKEEKLVLALFESYAALGLPGTARSGPFMDPDLVALVNERFVAFRMEAATEAVFRDAAVFGMGPNTFGTSYLFVRPDGRVVGETGISNASHLHEFARGILAWSAAYGSVPTPATPSGRLALAERRLRRGELDSAAQLVAEDSSPRAHHLRAARARILRQGKEALDELRAARIGADDALLAEVEMDEAVVLMRLARYEEAEVAFLHCLHREPRSARVPEALFWLGTFDVLRNGVEEGTARWAELAAAHPESPWAWKAAANLLERGSFVYGVERLDWPNAALMASVAPLARDPLGPTRLEHVEREAVAWLVKSQRADGTWICPSDAFSIASNLYTPAITALCGASLIPYSSHEGVPRARERCLTRVLELFRSGALDAGPDLAGVYSIWSRMYALDLVSRCLRAKLGDARELAAVQNELVASIQASRHPRGGWPYVFLPGDPKGEAFDPSSSFLAAGMVLTLQQARAAGAKVAPEVLGDALGFLQRLKEDDGSFRYMDGVPNALADGAYPEAAGRGPICALALLRGERAEPDLVRTTLRTFVAHRGGFRKEWHKELCHTSPEGFGSHYIFYDYAHAAEALRALPLKERGGFREAIVEDLLAARFRDGSFEDMPGLGRAYATAMALRTFTALRTE